MTATDPSVQTATPPPTTETPETGTPETGTGAGLVALPGLDTAPVQAPAPTPRPATATAGIGDPTFPGRVAVLMRSRPIVDASAAATRQDWPPDTYDIATLALALIDLVMAQQGFENETTPDEALTDLTRIAARSAPDRPGTEHAAVARYTLDALLNRGEREAPFTYRISDFTDPGHQQRQVQFRLLVEREDPVRGDVVLNVTGDAINALVGGLEFDVEDEQAANEFLLERQLARGAFSAAEAAAARARALSVRLALDLATLIKETRRDLRSVLDQWATTAAEALDNSREHIRSRIDIEHRLLTKVRETVTAEDPAVAAASARIADLLGETQRRHEDLHRQVLTARGVFLDEQNRQSFRPPLTGYLPDLTSEVLHPMLTTSTQVAMDAMVGWVSDVAGPCPPRLPRLYRLVNDLWTLREYDPDTPGDEDPDEVGDPDPPTLHPDAIDAAATAVEHTGLPARLSTLIAACHRPGTAPEHRDEAAEIVALAALWCYSPDYDEDEAETPAVSLAARLLGPRAVAATDGTALRLPGWDGDDLIVAPDEDALYEDTDPPPPVTRLPRTTPRTT